MQFKSPLAKAFPDWRLIGKSASFFLLPLPFGLLTPLGTLSILFLESLTNKHEMRKVNAKKKGEKKKKKRGALGALSARDNCILAIPLY